MARISVAQQRYNAQARLQQLIASGYNRGYDRKELYEVALKDMQENLPGYTLDDIKTTIMALDSGDDWLVNGGVKKPTPLSEKDLLKVAKDKEEQNNERDGIEASMKGTLQVIDKILYY